MLAPPWWRSSKTRLGLRLKARTGSKAAGSTGTIGLDGLCDVRWEAVLGDDKLGLAELRQLARLKQPLVRMRGQWVELHEEDLAAAITAVGKKGASRRSHAGRRGPAHGSRTRADHGWPAGRRGGGGRVARGPSRRCRRPAAASRSRRPTASPGSCARTRSAGSGWLAFLGDLGLGACLADDMGLGKTAQLLALLVDERSRAVEAPTQRGTTAGPKRRSVATRLGPTLVLCPMSLVGNWQREAARFAPKLSVYVHHGPDRLDGKAFTRHAGRTDLVLSTYGLATRDQQLLATCPGGGWSSTRRSRSRTVRPERPRASGRSRPSGGSP